jgi:organic radical activating enzyme
MVKYKFIEHERTEDAPFVGALIVASDCKIKCKECFNRDLKKMETKKDTAQNIIKEVLSNPFNEGIILAGLEWSSTPEDLVELVTEADKQGLKIMIYTGLELGEFEMKIGKTCCNKVGIKDLPKDYHDTNMMYACIGGMVLDNAIHNDYYIKTGAYAKELKVTDREAFGVKLATSNQNVIKIQKTEE